MRSLLVIATFLCFMPSLLADEVLPESTHVITLFMAPIDPYALQNKRAKNKPILEHPDTISRAVFDATFNNARNTSNQGVFVMYAGMSDMLDYNGQIILPRKHQSESLTYIITQSIKPVIIRGDTVNYFVRDEKYLATYYELTREFDATNNIYLWNTRLIPVPVDTKISPAAIVFIAEPDEIYVPEGTTIALAGPDLLLPTIYGTKKLIQQKDINAVFFLKINRYFSPVHFSYRISDKRYAQMVQT